MRFFTPLLCIAFLAANSLFAEGTRQVAPNASIDINGNTTNDIAALHINNPSYNSFGAYDSPNPQSRLNIHIKNPGTECIYLGFNWAHNNVSSPNPPRINFHYRIKDPNGNVVFGPVTVTPTEANIQTWSEAFTGPIQIHGAGGYNATQVTSLNLGSQGWTGAGDYYIEFRDDENNDLLIDYWDITVADCSTVIPTEKTGRVWSYNWSIFAINDFGFPNRPFNGAFYVCAPDPDNDNASFVTKIDFNESGFRPAAFNVAFNSFGSQNTGNVSTDRRSIENANATQAEYAIFLNDPIDICETASVGEITILGVSRCADGEFCIKFTTTKAGQIDLLLDFDGGDNMYTPGTADVMISRLVNAEEVGIPSCVEWNGLDGLGNPMPENAGTQIPVTIAFAQGIYHFPIYDAELMTDGFMIEAVRPAASVSLLFYDDSTISTPSGSGEPSVQLSGCMPPCHRWTNYTQPNTPGFGNLNTINSWWFSQLIIRQDVFFLPAFYTCEIEGPSHLCAGGTAVLTSNPTVSPEGAEGGEIISTIWNGPGILGSNSGASVTIGSGGTYEVQMVWLTQLGDTCSTSCSHEVVLDPPLTETIDTLIVLGQTININGQSYNEGGQFIQELTTSAGCDSILTINIVMLQTVIHYDLNDCLAFMSDGSLMDYSEFIPSYPEPLPCATITAGTLHRNNPQMNKHSCTSGVNNSTAMCVSSLEGCTYDAGNDVSVIFELTVTPDVDTAVRVTGISFYQKAPLTYEWISGASGPNNYPTLFGIRVLKNGVEIYRNESIPTSLLWKKEVFDFLNNDEFLVKDPTTFRFELLPYCLIGNGAEVAAWDLDEISVTASCASQAGLNKSISGTISTPGGINIPGVNVYLDDEVTFNHPSIQQTESSGQYLFDQLVPEKTYFLRGHKNTGFMNGVSTLDLVLIQKHLLGIKPFHSPYQMIAADANRSNNVSALDLIELRKLILGIYSELPHNTSWRFGIADKDLVVGYPWLFKETYTVEYLDKHLTDVDFKGVKIGDINGDVQLSTNGPVWTPRGNEALSLVFTDQHLAEGVPMKVEFKSSQFSEIAGMQFAFELTGGQILDVVSGELLLGKDNFIITPDGVLLMSWNGTVPLTINKDDVLFSVMVVLDQSGSISDQIMLSGELIHAEAYIGDDLEIVDVRLEKIISEENQAENYLFPNEPNPFSTSTVVRFQLEKSGEVHLRVFDLSGKLLTEKSGNFEKGVNAVEFSENEIAIKNGVVICQMQADGFVATQKMIVMRE